MLVRPTINTGADIRLGRWQDVLRNVEHVDTLITDPPYSARTDAGYMSHGSHDVASTADIGYAPITQADADELAAFWSPRVRRWAVIFGDHISREWHAAAWGRCGWYVFAPVIWVKRGAAPRFRADGPASQVDHIMVARPRRNLEACDMGSRPGWYLVGTPRGGNGSGVTGNKCPNGMRALVRDYSQPHDVIVDCYAGGGETLLAAIAEGRNPVAAEVDRRNYGIITSRLARGVTADLFAGQEKEQQNEQEGQCPAAVPVDDQPGPDHGEDRRRVEGLGEEHHGHQHGPGCGPGGDDQDQGEAEQGAQDRDDDGADFVQVGGGEAGRDDAGRPLPG